MKDRLLQLCADAGISRHGAGKRLSTVANVSVKTANKWLNGDTLPTLSSIMPLAAFFGVRAEWLLHGQGDPYVVAQLVDQHSLLSEPVTRTAACSKLVVHHLRIITLAALNGELSKVDNDALARIVEHLDKRNELKAA